MRDRVPHRMYWLCCLLLLGPAACLTQDGPGVARHQRAAETATAVPDDNRPKCDGNNPGDPEVIQDGDEGDTYIVQYCGPVCTGFPIPPLEEWDPNPACYEAQPDGIAAGADAGTKACEDVCTAKSPYFIWPFRKKQCPRDVPADQLWLWNACVSVSGAAAFARACAIMPPPVDKVCKAAAAGGKAACCSAVLDTKVPPTWKCAYLEAAKPAPRMVSCNACCDTEWPIGTRPVQNNACKNSCIRAGNGLW